MRVFDRERIRPLPASGQKNNPVALAAKDLLDERFVRKEWCPSNDRLFLKAKDLAVLRGEAIHHLGLLLFHVDDLFPLRIFVGRCPGDEG